MSRSSARNSGCGDCRIPAIFWTTTRASRGGSRAATTGITDAPIRMGSKRGSGTPGSRRSSVTSTGLWTRRRSFNIGRSNIRSRRCAGSGRYRATSSPNSMTSNGSRMGSWTSRTVRANSPIGWPTCSSRGWSIARATRTAIGVGESVEVAVRLAGVDETPEGCKLAWRFADQTGDVPIGAEPATIELEWPARDAIAIHNLDLEARDGAGRLLVAQQPRILRRPASQGARAVALRYGRAGARHPRGA